MTEPRVPIEQGADTIGHVEGAARLCPFCGSDRVYISYDPGEYDDPSIPARPTWAAVCAGCAAQGPWNKQNADAALISWNRRLGDPVHGGPV